jgi:thioesterase domain-containing protein
VQQLRKLGVKVKGLILIDSPSPINHKPLPDEVIAYVTRSNSTDGTLAQEFRRNASLLGLYEPRPLDEKAKLNVIMLRSKDTFDTETLCSVRYDWLSSQDARAEDITKWESLAGSKVNVLPIRGNHFEPFTSENVRNIFLGARPTSDSTLTIWQIEDTSAQLWKACQLVTQE